MEEGSVPVGTGCDPNAPRWQEPADQVVDSPAEAFSGEVSVQDFSSDSGSGIEVPIVEVVPSQDGETKSSTTETETSNSADNGNPPSGDSSESPIVAPIL